MAVVAAGRGRTTWRSRIAAGADFAGFLVRGLPGFAGAALVSYGAYAVYAPAGFIAAGVFLLLLDRVTR